MPLSSRSAVDSEYPVDSCCLLQDVAERSQQKSGMLQGYGDVVLRADALEEQLMKARKHSVMLQSKLDGAFAKCHNEVQDMQAKSDELVRKNKSLRNKNKGTCCLVEYLLGVPCSSLTHLACWLQSLRLVSSN
jgi:FtsZ-binding cell division protein ZapB